MEKEERVGLGREMTKSDSKPTQLTLLRRGGGGIDGILYTTRSNGNIHGRI